MSGSGFSFQLPATKPAAAPQPSVFSQSFGAPGAAQGAKPVPFGTSTGLPSSAPTTQGFSFGASQQLLAPKAAQPPVTSTVFETTAKPGFSFGAPSSTLQPVAAQPFNPIGASAATVSQASKTATTVGLFSIGNAATAAQPVAAAPATAPPGPSVAGASGASFGTFGTFGTQPKQEAPLTFGQADKKPEAAPAQQAPSSAFPVPATTVPEQPKPQGPYGESRNTIAQQVDRFTARLNESIEAFYESAASMLLHEKEIRLLADALIRTGNSILSLKYKQETQRSVVEQILESQTELGAVLDIYERSGEYEPGELVRRLSIMQSNMRQLLHVVSRMSFVNTDIMNMLCTLRRQYEMTRQIVLEEGLV